MILLLQPAGKTATKSVAQINGIEASTSRIETGIDDVLRENIRARVKVDDKDIERAELRRIIRDALK